MTFVEDEFGYIWFPNLQEIAQAMITEDEIHNRYHYHAPTPAARILHDHFNQLLEHVAVDIEKNIPEGRAKALAHTNLEQTKMWVNAAIAQNHDKL